MKSYTDLGQSRKLAGFLPHGSADMYYEDDISVEFGHGWHAQHIPCWSLSALLEVIPQEIFDGEYIINITEGSDNRWVLTYDHYENRNHSYYSLSTGADNLIDACVAIIIKLHELNLL